MVEISEAVDLAKKVLMNHDGIVRSEEAKEYCSRGDTNCGFMQSHARAQAT